MNNDLIQQPNWWKKNWKWVVPVGGCFTLVLVLVIFIGSIFYGVTNMIEKATPYEYALKTINQDEEITAILGTPIEKNGMLQGRINYSNGDGRADIKIPVSGPKGSGMLSVKASSIGENWTYHEIRLEIKDDQSIDLLNEELEQF